jgi:hypothetical protein
MCCFRVTSERASLRSDNATANSALRTSSINDNRIRMRRAPHPVRWRDMRIAVTVAPTLAIITMIASYYFGIH